MAKKIVLASQSPRRKLLLEWAGIVFDVMAKPTDESFPPDMPVEEVPVHIARKKALALSKDPSFHHFEKDTPILAADTIVVIGNRVIGKPSGPDEAIRILKTLSGNTHHVITGVVILHSGKETTLSETTEVTFHPLTDQQIEYYVANFQPYDKAGAYGIQEWIGVIGIARIHGDFYNVMGLPVSKVVRILNELGL